MDTMEEHVRSLSDAELFAMLRLRREDWSDQALEIGSDEWRRRGISDDHIPAIEHGAQEVAAAAEAHAYLPLPWPQRILFFCFGFSLCVGLFVAFCLYKQTGHDRMFQQAVIAMLCGIGALMAGVFGFQFLIALLA
jgi:hypothetical protein